MEETDLCSDDDSEGNLNLPPKPSSELLHNFDKTPISDDTDNAYDTCFTTNDDSNEGNEGDEFGLYDETEIEEIEEFKYVTTCESTYGVDENVFTPLEMNELKRRELALIERSQKGYYCCKVRHTKLYNEMTDVYTP